MTSVEAKNPKKALAARDDARLVKLCLSGSEEAWHQLIDKYRALIYSIPIKYGLPADEATEVFQVTCVELLHGLPQLRDTRALPKWLIQVAYHQCHHWRRQQARTISRDADDHLPEPGIDAVADTLIQQTQEEQLLREAMASLTPQCKRLVELLFYESPPRPYAEVAADLGLASGSIGFTRQKCIERLRRTLQGLGFR